MTGSQVSGYDAVRGTDYGREKRKGKKRGKAFRVQLFSIYTRVRDPRAGALHPTGGLAPDPQLLPLLPSGFCDDTVLETSRYKVAYIQMFCLYLTADACHNRLRENSRLYSAAAVGVQMSPKISDAEHGRWKVQGTFS